MDAFAILRAFGALALIIAAAALAVGGVAALQGDTALASGFVLSAAVSVFIGASMRIMASGRTTHAGVREALAFAILAWTLAPALAAAPFYFAGSGSALHAYTDALSAVTTTGLPPFFARGGAPDAAILWWNLLQWAGGGATVLTALVILATVNLGGAGLHRSPLFTLEPDRLFDRFAPVGRAVFVVYALGTGLSFALTWPTAGDAGIAASVALAGVATGGLLLPNGGTTLAGAPLGLIVAACVPLMFGAFNFALHWDVVRGRGPRGYLADGESRALLVFFGVSALVVAVASGANGAAELLRAGAQGLTLATTAGWDVGGAGAGALSAPLILVLVIIGGSPTSTAGGVKLVRVTLLARQASAELRRLANPSAIHELRFRGKTLPSRAIMSMLAAVLAYAVGLAALIIAFGAANVEFEVALAAAGAALTNAGPALYLIAGADAWSTFDNSAGLITFCVGMILGRVEVFAACAIFVPTFWRN